MEERVHLSIVLPCYNPTDEWLENVISAYTNIKTEINDIELLLVNDGSIKNSPKNFAASFSANNIQMISYDTNRGKGFALRQGVKQTKGELVIYTDIDFPYKHASFMAIYRSLAIDKNDVAIGIRGEEYYTHLPKARVYISKTLRFFIQLLLQIPSDDTQCGLKGFNQNGKPIFLKTSIDRYLFDLEFIYLAAREKLKIKTVEVILRDQVLLSSMSTKTLIHESINFIRVLWRSIIEK